MRFGRKAALFALGCALLILGLMVLISAPALAAVPAWDAFSPATFTGITLTPSLADGVLNYTLSLGASPTITIGATTYDVDWIQMVCALSYDGVATFQATDGGNSQGWTFSNKPPNGDDFVVAGWGGSGSASRLYPGDSMTFSYGVLDSDCNPLIAGYHIGYGNGAYTAFFKEVVPEPSSLMLLVPGLAALAGIRFRRRK